MHELKITRIQARYISIIDYGLMHQDQIPPMEQIAQELDVYASAVADIFKRLEQKRVLERNLYGRWKRGPLWHTALKQAMEFEGAHVGA